MSASLAVLAPTPSLPALIDLASRRLADARSSGEVLEARKIAQAALHYARVTKAANDTHADCLRIITRAEIRMADAIDEGQAKGEVAEKGRPENPRTAGIIPAALDELGVSSQRVAEWRELRNAGEPAVEAAIQTQLAEGKSPTKSGIQAVLAGFTGNAEWYTPAEWIERARAVMGTIDLDPATSQFAQETVKAADWADAERDGLTREWRGNVWLNPPYARGLIEKFVAKALLEFRERRLIQAIILTDNRTDTGWFHELSSASSAVAFTRGRIRFYNEKNPHSSSPPNGSAFFYIGRNVGRFAAEFGDECLIFSPRQAPQ